jgi:hypothetical protein
MNILFNFCTNTIGGGLKNALEFIKNDQNISTVNYFFLLNRTQLEYLPFETIHTMQYHVIDKNPAYSIVSKFKILLFIKQKRIDIIYTMAGPCYFPVPVISILGLSNPYITHCNFSEYRQWLSLFCSLKSFLHINLQKFCSIFSNYYIFQTKLAQSSYLRYNVFLSKSNSHVITNAYSDIKTVSISPKKNLVSSPNTFYIFCPGSFYPHKNFEIIGEVSEYLLDNYDCINYKFIFTMSSQDFKMLNFDHNKSLLNIGNLPYEEFISIYNQVDLVFLPSFLETFSSVYIESMYFKKFLLLHDNEISRDNCKEGAFYCDCTNAMTVAKNIHSILNNSIPQLYFKNQSNVLSNYTSQIERYESIIRCINIIYEYENKKHI